MKKHLLFVFGTRPEVIKLAPLISVLRKNGKLSIEICNTEQQKELSNQAMNYFGIKPDISLDVMTANQTLTNLQAKLMKNLQIVFDRKHYDGVVIQGDTMTVLAAALVSFYNKVPVFHVEAGLRTQDLYSPFPEECIRRLVSRIAELHFAPTEMEKEVLLSEGISEKKVYVTGNTSIDAVKALVGDYVYQNKKHNKQILVTVHRRENQGKKLLNIISAVKALAQEFPDFNFVLPVHPNPNVKNIIESSLSCETNIDLCPPLDYPELITRMAHSSMIMTDSGGIQEEATLFGIPIIVLRDSTERMEGVYSGHSYLVGTEQEKIISMVSYFLRGGKQRISKLYPYGNGTASVMISQVIEDYLTNNVTTV